MPKSNMDLGDKRNTKVNNITNIIHFDINIFQEIASFSTNDPAEN